MADIDLPVWSFAPNWQTSVTETLEFKTDVLTSEAGDEQRRELRLSPRRMLEYTLAVYGPERTRFDLAVAAAGGSEWLLPIWPYVSTLTTKLGTAGRIAYTDTRGREYRVGDLAIVIADASNFFVSEITAVFDDQVQLARTSGRVWPVGTTIYPLRKARFTEQPKSGRLNDTVYTANVRFRLTTENDLPADYFARVDETFRNRLVITARPNESSKLDYDYARLLDELDNGLGLVSTVDLAGRAFPMQQYTWLTIGRDERCALRSLLYALAGKQHSCWIPTFASDLEVTSSATAGSTTLIVKACGYTDFGGAVSARQYARIALDDGSGVCVRIINSAYTDDTRQFEALTLADPLVAPLDLARVRQTSFLTFARLDQDSIEIVHVTDIDGAATCQVVFRALSPLELDAGAGTGFGYNFGEDFGVTTG